MNPRSLIVSFTLVLLFQPDAARAGTRPETFWQLGGHTSRIDDLAVSPDGSLTATCGEDGTLKLWNVATGQLAMTLTLPADNFNSPFGIYGVTFSPDGQVVWGASIGGGYGWRISDGTLVDSKVTMESAGQVFFSRDGQYLGLAGSPTGSEDTTEVYQRSDGSLLRRFDPASSQAAVFSADSQFLIAGNSLGFSQIPGVIRYYRLSDGGLERSISAHADLIEWLTLSPDGAMLASCSLDQTIKLWNAASGALLRTLTGHTQGVYRVRFSPDGARLASSGFDGTLRIWNPSTGELQHTFAPTSSGLGGLSWLPDGESIMVASGSQFFPPHVSVQRVNAESGASIRSFLTSEVGLYDLAISPVGPQFAVSYYLGPIQVRNISDGSLVWVTTSNPTSNQVAFSADGSRLAAGGNDGVVRFYDAATGAFQQQFTAQSSAIGGVGDLIVSPDGHSLATRKFNENGNIWNYPALSPRTPLTATATSNATFKYMPDGQSIAVAGPNGTLLLRASDASQIRFLTGHTERTVDVAVNADGSRLVSGSQDHTARLYNPTTGEFLRSFGPHDGTVTAVAITPDGHTVATGTTYYDRRLRFWNADSGALLASYVVDSGTGILRSFFSHNGDRLICIRNDGSIVAVRNPAQVRGDIDGDGDIDLADAAALTAAVIGTPQAPEHVGRSDLNGDSRTDGLDIDPFVSILLGH